MPNWCANRIQITAPLCLLADVEAWVNGTATPYYRRAINQSIRLFIAGVTGRLKPAKAVQYAPYPALTAHGCGELSSASLAFTAWFELLNQNAFLDENCCSDINRIYHESGIAGLKWEALTRQEQEIASEIISRKYMDWSPLKLESAGNEALFNALDNDPDGETLDLRLILPTRLACEINGFNGRLLDRVPSACTFYCETYGTKWPSDNGAEVEILTDCGVINIDMDTAWSPPAEEVVEAISARWSCEVTHYFSEAGVDYCGYRQYQKGIMVDYIESCLEYGEEDKYGWSHVIGPDWIVDNVAHYGG